MTTFFSHLLLLRFLFRRPHSLLRVATQGPVPMNLNLALLPATPSGPREGKSSSESDGEPRTPDAWVTTGKDRHGNERHGRCFGSAAMRR